MLNSFPSLLDENQQCNNAQAEVTYSYQEWFRLRETWSTFTNLQKTICSYSKQLEAVIIEENDFRERENASEIQNLKARVKILERNISITRELICTARYRLNGIIAENDEFEIKIKNNLDLSLVQTEIIKQQEQITEDRIKLRKLQNELTLRRRYMFKNLNDIFFPRGPANNNNFTPIVFKKNCLCIKFDCIRGLHLPTVAARLGHNDIELCAAAGILIHLLECISAILCYPLKHLITFNGSRSMLTTLSKMESFNLFNSNSSKNSRDRFDQALYLLCEVVVQLRAHCGIETRELDRPIQSLRELLLTFTGLYRFSPTELIAKFDKISHLSPSIYISIDKEEDKIAKKNSADFILHNFMPLLK